MEERSQPWIYMGLREYTGEREGGVVANNGTHSHSGSTYTFLVASLFSRPVSEFNSGIQIVERVKWI